MNTAQALRLSLEHGRVSFFECRDLFEAIQIALDIRSRADSVIGEFNGVVGVLAFPKAEVM